MNSHSILYVYLIFGLIFCSQSFQISPGQGYSFVTDDIAPVKCFRLSSLQTTSQQSRLELSSAYTSDSLATELGIEATMKGGFSIFSGDATVQYMNSIVEDSLSFSLNYFHKIWHTVEMTYPGTKDQLLSNEGKPIYGDGTASNFRTLCGEQLIKSYEEGAVVIFSLKMSFKNKTQKEQFKAQLNINTPFLDITNQLTSASAQTQTSGTLSISAYQLGGNPIELATVLSSQIVQCSFDNLSACQGTLVNSIDYIRTQFPAQLRQPENPFVALGSYTVVSEYITNYGIQLPPNPLTWEIIAARTDLLNAYRQNKLNELNLESLQEQGYEPYIPSLSRFIYNIKQNLNTINNGVLSGPASSCWQTLESCLTVRDEIITNLIPFTFDPDTVRFCNPPDINAEDWCGTKYPDGFRYEYGAYWNTGTYMNSPNAAGTDGKCTANAMARFSREKRGLLGVFGGRDWMDLACGESVYDSVIDPTFNWLDDLDDISSPLFSSWGTNSGELIEDQVINEELELAGFEENQEEEFNFWN